MLKEKVSRQTSHQVHAVLKRVKIKPRLTWVHIEDWHVGSENTNTFMDTENKRCLLCYSKVC